MRARPYIFGHAGTEEMAGAFPQSLFLLHASSTISLEVHHPMAQRVYALTFHRHTCPRCGDR
jgi:hypothetical protein